MPTEVKQNEGVAAEFGADSNRHQTVDQHLPLVRQIAGMLYVRRVRDDVPFEEYYQHGVVGLLEAVERYDPASHAAFETYATFRIRGAILNGLTHESERRAHNEYLRRLRHERIELDDERRTQPDGGFKYLMSLAVRLALGYVLERDRDDSVRLDKMRFDRTEFAVLCKQIHGVAEGLPEQERAVIHAHYYEHLSFDQVAERLGLTKGRVAQVHRSALEKIQALLVMEEVNDTF